MIRKYLNMIQKLKQLNKMKKILTLLLLIIIGCTVVNAETTRFKSRAVSLKTLDSNGYWNNWSDWESTEVLITIDSSLITIYSQKIQSYQIISNGNSYIEEGIKCIDFKFIDQDGDRGTMTFATKPSGQSEIYIRFKNVQWVYIVIRI